MAWISRGIYGVSALLPIFRDMVTLLNRALIFLESQMGALNVSIRLPTIPDISAFTVTATNSLRATVSLGVGELVAITLAGLASINAIITLIADIVAALNLTITTISRMAGGSVDMFAYTGKISGLAAEFTGAVSGASMGAKSYAILLVATAPPAVSALRTIFGVTI